MFDRIKGIFGAENGKPEETPVEFPEIKPFSEMTVDTPQERLGKPDHKKLDINHEGHMRIIARSDADAKIIADEALNTARDKKTVNYRELSISAYLSGTKYLRFLTLMKNSDRLVTYPVMDVGEPLPARITSITECENGYEGQLEIFVNGATVEMFDAAYFANKNTYVPGKDVKVVLAGIAYVLSRMSRPEPEKKKGKKAPKKEQKDEADLAFRYENGDVDDYVFRGIVEEAGEFEVLGKKAQVIRTSLRLRGEAELDIYICVTENAMREKLHKGDHVSGIIWLQGYVVA